MQHISALQGQQDEVEGRRRGGGVAFKKRRCARLENKVLIVSVR